MKRYVRTGIRTQYAGVFTVGRTQCVNERCVERNILYDFWSTNIYFALNLNNSSRESQPTGIH